MRDDQNDPKLSRPPQAQKLATAVNDNDPEFHRDLLRGNAEITEFLFGSREQRLRRRLYHLIATSTLRNAVFKMGSMWCARRSTLMRWVVEQESKRRDENGKRG
jgi:hypothetical protein